MVKRQSDLNQPDVHDSFPTDRLSDAVEEAIEAVENPDWAREQRAILERMKTDARMKKVWNLLLGRKRPSRNFAYPARPRASIGSKSTDEMQFDALRELFYVRPGRGHVFILDVPQPTAEHGEPVAVSHRMLPEEMSRSPRLAS